MSLRRTAVSTKPVPAVATNKKTEKRATVDNWDSGLGFLMHDVSRLRRRVFDRFMKPLGLTRSQWWILARLSTSDGMIQNELAEVLDLGKAALGDLLDRLEASNFVERRTDAADRRVKRIFISKAGAGMISSIRSLSHDTSERILDGLDNAQRHELVKVLGLVKGNLLAILAEEPEA